MTFRATTNRTLNGALLDAAAARFNCEKSGHVRAANGFPQFLARPQQLDDIGPPRGKLDRFEEVDTSTGGTATGCDDDCAWTFQFARN